MERYLGVGIKLVMKKVILSVHFITRSAALGNEENGFDLSLVVMLSWRHIVSMDYDASTSLFCRDIKIAWCRFHAQRVDLQHAFVSFFALAF